ncbi:MAG TPA: hypothetical protein VID75_12230, partial [Acidimicrobiales bacterium]
FASCHVDSSAMKVAVRSVVGTERIVETAAEAAEGAPGWRRSQPAVVAVDAPVESTDRAWARHLIASLLPTAVWGVVDATCKAEDVASWAAGLGGLDALALENVPTTVSPGTVLQAGVPVARLDGRAATPESWTHTAVTAAQSVNLSDLAQPSRRHS